MNTSIKLADIKASARGHLQGNYAQVISTTISYFIFMLFLEALSELFNHDTSSLAFSIGAIAALVINAISVKYKISMSAYFLDIAQGKKSSVINVYNSFFREGGGKSGLALSIAVFQQVCMLPAYITAYIFDSEKDIYTYILLGAIILGLILYTIIDIKLMPAYFLVSDVPNLSSARAMLTGLWLSNKQFFRILLLRLSFLPLYLMGFLSCGIGVLYVYPYMMTSDACYYLELCKSKELASSNPSV